MTQQLPAFTTAVNGEDIGRIIEKIEPILAEEMQADVYVASITMALLIQKPDITSIELQDGILAVSRFMCLLLEAVPGDADPSQAN